MNAKIEVKNQGLFCCDQRMHPAGFINGHHLLMCRRCLYIANVQPQAVDVIHKGGDVEITEV